MIIIIIALIINDFLRAKLAITPLYLHYFDQSFCFVLCVGWGWLSGVNDPRAGFVRCFFLVFFARRGQAKCLTKGEEGLRIMY